MATKLDVIYERVPEHTKLMVSKSFDISERILNALDRRGWTQKDLAEKLSKKESEISRWMKGTHNFTLETIAKIELALGETILDTSRRPASRAGKGHKYRKKV
ncbi:helix-turn-helix transcriptional regulator [Chitinophaga sp.]|uniref:helix-turn-helix domain-containing protein n=1 Tax=Chitinophaga sp. TaxID=1869181 RepID=UPI0031E12136